MQQNLYSLLVYFLYIVVLSCGNVLCYPYDNIEGGQVMKNIIAPTIAPRITAVPGKPIADVKFGATPNPLSPDKDFRAEKYPRRLGTDIFKSCPVVNRQPCGPLSRQLCARWDCCWDSNSPVVCAKANYLMTDSLEVCGSSEYINSRPKPMTDLKNNLMWLLLARGKRSTDEEPTKLPIKQRIVGGREAPKHSFPWTARIYEKDDETFTVCGATLISHQWVVTAAHCIIQNNPSLYTIVLGDHDTRTRDGNEQFKKVSKIVIKEGYVLKNFHNDIALMKLSSPATYNEYVSPVCLPPQGTPTDGDYRLQGSKVFEFGYALGWGDFVSGAGQGSKILLVAQLQVRPHSFCVKTFETVSTGDSKFCAGTGTSDTCGGDSGGAFVLINFDDKKIYMHGVLSHGYKKCGVMPSVYTKVSDYTDWIMETISD